MASIKLDILADISSAVKDINKFSKDATKSLGNVESSFAALGTAAKGLGGIFASALAGFSLHAVIHESVEAELVVRKLQSALKLAGDTSTETLHHFEELAIEIQNLIGVDDDAVISQLAYLKTLGATNKQAEEVIRVAADLASALGKDLDSAVKTLATSFSGKLERSLVRQFPALKQFSEAQLQAGAAVEFFSQKLSGTAANIQGSASIQLAVLTENFKNLLQAIGDIITKSPIFIDGLLLINKTLASIVVAVKSVNFSDLIEGLVRLTSAATIFALAFSTAFRARVVTAILSATASFRTFVFSVAAGSIEANVGIIRLISGIISLKTAINLLKAAATLGLTLFIDQIITAVAETKSLGQAFQLLGLKAKKLGLEILNIISLLATRGRGPGAFAKEIEDAAQGIDKIKKENLEGLIHGFGEARDNAKGLGQEVGKTKEEIGKMIADLAKNPFSALDPKNIKGLDQIEIGVSVAAGGISSALKGASGATELLKEGISTAFNAILPGIGAIAGEIFAVLAQGPEQVTAMVNSFIAAIPTIIENVLLSIPALITALIEGLATLPEKLAEKAPLIIEGIIQSLPKLFTAIISNLPLLAFRFSLALIQNIPSLIQVFAREMLKIPAQFGKALVDEIKKLLGGIGGQGLGGTGILGSEGILGIKGVPFLAEGGIVPPGFANDSFFAGLSSGEVVLDRSTTGRLLGFLDSFERQGPQAGRADTAQSQPQNVTVNLVVGEQQLANVILNLNRQGFRLA